MRSSLLLAALLAAACLAHGAEPTTPRRSLTLDLISTRPRSASDKDKCFKSLLALGLCKHELLLATFFPGRRVPPACCRAADEVDDHCGPVTRAVVRSLPPRGLLQRCARQVVVGGAPTSPSSSLRRRAPPPAAAPSAPYGARASPAPEARARARAPPPPATTAYAAPGPKAPASARRLLPPHAPKSSGRVPNPPGAYGSVHPPTSYPRTAPRGKYTPPPPNVGSGGAQAPVISGGPSEARAPQISAKPVKENAPKPKVIAGGGRTRRAPGGYVPATGTPGILP